jgi:SOS-response transcriptional repressor LexA
MLVMEPEITAEKLKAFRKRMRLTQDELAKELSVSRSAYKNWEYGHANVPKDVAQGLFKLGFLNEVGPPTIPASELQVPVPYIGPVSASTPADWSDPFEALEFEFVPPEMGHRDAFACRIAGDSMFDLLWPEDVAVFIKQDVPKIGAVVLYRHHDNRITVKQLKHDGQGFYLHALNPSIPDCPAEGSMVGYLIGIVRHTGSRKMTLYDRTGIRP